MVLGRRITGQEKDSSDTCSTQSSGDIITTCGCYPQPWLIKPPNSHPFMTTIYVDQLLTNFRALNSLGGKVMPVVQSSITANGKAPSFYTADGSPTLITERHAWSFDQFDRQVKLAAKLGRSIGVAIQPSEGLVIVDLDSKNYLGGTAELLEDHNRLVVAYPALKQTRTEMTTNGGLHIYVKVRDLSEWDKGDGSLARRLTTTAGGTLRGELLASNSICVAAPSHERYKLLEGYPVGEVVTINTLQDIGIFPVQKPVVLQQHRPVVPPTPPVIKPNGFKLRELLGLKAKNVLKGEFAYSDSNTPKQDRSLQLTGFAKEAFGVENLATSHGKALSETADELIEEVVAVLGLDDKRAQTILKPLIANRSSYRAGNPDLVKDKLGVDDSKPQKQQSFINSCTAQNEAQKLLGTIRLRVRTEEVELPNGTILSRDDIATIYLDLSVLSNKQWPKNIAQDAVNKLAKLNQYDHIRDEFLKMVRSSTPLPDAQWDQLDQLIFGINDPIARMFMPKYLIGAVARLMVPACPCVPTPVLIGKQGIGKSLSCKALFGDEYVVDDIGYSLDKDDISRAHRYWCTELAEMDGITSRGDRERLKAFLVRERDTYRRPYAGGDTVYLRRFVFWGTSNSVPMNDPTGNRRFVAIDLLSKDPSNPIPIHQIKTHRAAIWARAYQEWESGTTYHLTPAEQTLVDDANSIHTSTDTWSDRLAEALVKDPGHTCLSVSDGFKLLGIEPVNQHAQNTKRMHEALRSLGYRSAKVTLPGGSRATRYTNATGMKQKPLNTSRCITF
jgi:predicted P-loop ATPase